MSRVLLVKLQLTKLNGRLLYLALALSTQFSANFNALQRLQRCQFLHFLLWTIECKKRKLKITRKLEHCLAIDRIGMFEFMPSRNPMELFNKIELFRWKKKKLQIHHIYFFERMRQATMFQIENATEHWSIFVRMCRSECVSETKQCYVLKCKYLITFATVSAAL